jgi:MFS transporter, DHA1 family, multidrug resistance protein
MAIIRDPAGKEQTVSRLGYAAMIWALAPIVGSPTINGKTTNSRTDDTA